MSRPRVPAGAAATADRKGRQLTGERPQQGVTPDSLLALHAAGYRTVIERLGSGTVLDVGCGQGFESARFLAPDRRGGRGRLQRRGRRGGPAAARAARAAGGPDERAGPRVRRGQLRLGLLVPPDRALRRARGPRAPSWPGCWPTTGRPSSSPRTPRPTSRTRSTSTCSSRRSCAALLGRALPRRHRPGPRRRAPREGRLHRPAGQGREGAAGSTSSTCGTGSRGRGTSASTPGPCPWPTG